MFILKGKNKLQDECIKICLLYLIFGLVWVYLSDKIINKLIVDRDMLPIINVYKGFIYVIITSITLYLLINSLVKKIELAQNKLNQSYDELSAVNGELEAYVQQLMASEEELRIQEEKNTAIINAIPDLLFVIDNKGNFIDCMASDESLLLMPKKDFIGKSIFEIMPKDISDIAYEKIQLVLRCGVAESFEYNLNIGSKEQNFELRMVKNNEKEILAISRNVTIEKQNELRLKISEEKFKTLVNEMQQGLALFEGSPDENGEVVNLKLIDVNRSYEKLTGLRKKDILGKNTLEIFPNMEKSLIEKIENVAKSGKSIKYERYREKVDKYYEAIVYRPKRLQFAAIITDITERKLAEKALMASEYNFRSIFEGSSDAILIVEDNRIIDCNLAMVKALGFDSKSFILGRCPFDFYPEKQPDGKTSEEKAWEMREHTMENGKCKFEWWYKRSDGCVLPVEVMLSTIFLNGKKVLHSLWRDISERKEMECKLEYLSYHDQLTGLYNRRFFEDELKRTDIEKSLPLAIIMADVNGLKLINDSFGHTVGDKLLRKVVEVIKKGCRKDDIIARLGGDEFVILMPNTCIYEAEQVVKDIKTFALDEKVESIDISISFGYEVKNSKEEHIQDILKKAEDHMYKKKLLESPSMRGKTVNAIITALHEKNKREEQHSHRVSSLCGNMGRALGLAEDDIKELKTVGLLHDIGKIAIEENILNKNGKLTNEEWEEIKRHPEIGYRILSTVNEMSEMAEYVLAHHERWDGLGYPKGLKGEDIPFKSRIITIVDAYDAMVSERSYRNALPEEVAIRELKTNAGSQFDSELIKIFIEKVLNKTI